METRCVDNDSIKEKLEEFERQAENSISKTESNGYIPLIAINYLEYGKNLDDVSMKLIYFKYAIEFSKLTEDVNDILYKKYGSEYKNIETPIIRKTKIRNEQHHNQIIVGFLIGFIFSYFIFKLINKCYK